MVLSAVSIYHLALSYCTQNQNMASKRRYTSKQVVEILQNIESYESESEIKGQKLTTWLDVLDQSSHTRAYHYNQSHKLASN